jgi:hypothetical protein
MKLNQRAAMVIRSLMRDLSVSEHIVVPHDKAIPSFRATKVVEELETAPETVDRYKLVGYLTYDEKGQDEEFMKSSLGDADFAAGCTQKAVYAKTEGPHVGDGSGDAALAIGEHAHNYGFAAALAYAKANGWTPTDKEALIQATWQAWSDYDPPEHIKGLS